MVAANFLSPFSPVPCLLSRFLTYTMMMYFFILGKMTIFAYDMYMVGPRESGAEGKINL